MKSMRKTSRGTGFRGVLNYALEDGKGVVIGGNMSGRDAASLASEFGISRRQRPDIEKPVWHQALRLPNGEKLSNEQWCQIGDAYMKKMGFSENHQRLYIIEDDPDGQHIHIPASRIALDGKLYYGQNENLISTRATQEIEREFGLILTKGPSYDDDGKIVMPKVSRPKPGEVNMAIQTGEQPPRMQIQHAIAEILKEKPTTIEFIDKLELAGITAVPNIASTGRMNGFSFEMDGIRFTGSQLGQDYKWAKLEQRIDYEQARDSQQLAEYKQAAIDRNSEADRLAELHALDRPVSASQIGSDLDSVADVAPGREPDSAIGRVPDSDSRSDSAAVKDDHASERLSDPIRETDGISQRSGSGSDDRSASSGSISRDGSSDSGKIEQVLDDESYRALPSKQHSVELISDLSAPVKKTDTEHAGRAGSSQILDASPDRDTTVKRAAWSKQSKALDAEQYRITLVGRKESQPKGINLGKAKDGGEEKFYSKDEVADLIPALRRHNAQGFDIYVTPIDRHTHYILIDDVKPESMQKLKTDGWVPALVQESSKDNRQAIIKAHKSPRDDEQQIANKLVSGLNQKYGDPKLSGVVHGFRMAGFSNQKPGRDRAFTIMKETPGLPCNRADAVLKKWRTEADILTLEKAKEALRLADEKERARRMQCILEPVHDAKAKAKASVGYGSAYYDELYLKTARSYVKQYGADANWSAIDYRCGVAIVAQGGGDIDDATAAIRRNSPALADRHSDTESYLQKTSAAILANDEVKKEQEHTKTRQQGMER